MPKNTLHLQMLKCQRVLSRSVTSNSVTLWTVAHQASLSMGLSGEEEWLGLPLFPLGDLSDPVIEPRLLCLLHWPAGSYHQCRMGSPETLVSDLQQTRKFKRSNST